MKNKYLALFFLMLFQFGFSQVEKPIQGKVLCDDFPLQGIEVVNLVSEKTTITDIYGRFTILAKAEDMLVFISKNYEYKRLFLEKEFINTPNLIITLIRKPEELEEVVVTKISFPHIGFNQEYADNSTIEKAANHPKPIGVYDGTLVNSPDLMRIGGMILSLFKKEKDAPKKNTPKITFKDLAITTYDQDFFSKKLKLKLEETALFLDFCDADPKSKIIIENANPLSLMDFLFEKNVEFKNLPHIIN
ncbi:MAG: hypothetical protein PHC28_04450 [Flavobacterium sp.]|uniref:hypothetical protein n=1 Tax=Flavobacterium sp. TaxID=239 RepID=UPI00261B8618|nr:hypothetical protein [Flavobacterium sp.]MDD5149714.1 hypothetical protein [Flavobacterium sp.]